MESIAEHHIESEVAAPPPRMARLPLGTSALLTVAAALFCVFLYGGGRALLEAVKLAWLGVGGRSAAATITAVQTAPPTVQGQSARQVGLRYVIHPPFGAAQSGWARLYDGPSSEPPPVGDRREGGATAQARHMRLFHRGDTLLLRFAPWPGGPISHPWSPPPYGKMVFLALSGGLVAGVSLLLLRRMLAWRRRRLYLLREGIATVGTIVHKHANADDSLRYFVRFGYASDGHPLEHEEQVSAEQWKTFEVGQPVTVLYDPHQPGDASLYRLMSR